MSAIDDLERLAALRKKGLLTEAEFEEAKRMILSGAPSEKPGEPEPAPRPEMRGPDRAQPTPLSSDQPPSEPRPTETDTSEPNATAHRASEPAERARPPLLPKTEKKDEGNGMLRGILALGSAIILAMILFGALSDQGERLSIRSPVQPKPDPVVVDQSANDDNSSLFEYRATVKATIRNKGVDGYVVIRAEVEQGGKTYERKDRRYMNAEENANVEFTIDDVESGAKWKYSVTAVGE